MCSVITPSRVKKSVTALTLSGNAGVINFDELNLIIKKIVTKVIYGLNFIIWLTIKLLKYKRESKFLSPYIIYIGKVR